MKFLFFEDLMNLALKEVSRLESRGSYIDGYRAAEDRLWKTQIEVMEDMLIGHRQREKEYKEILNKIKDLVNLDDVLWEVALKNE